MNEDRAAARPPWYLEPYVWLIILIPACAVAGGIVMFVLALVSDDGLVVDDYYRRGLAVNQRLQREHAAVRHQLQATFEVDRRRGEIRLELSAAPDFRYPAALRARFSHATRSGNDRETMLARRAGTIYRGSVGSLVPGRWHLELSADDWRLVHTFTVD
jgi:hypothetical protein